MKKLELSPQNFRYGVLHLLYSIALLFSKTVLQKYGCRQVENPGHIVIKLQMLIQMRLNPIVAASLSGKVNSSSEA